MNKVYNFHCFSSTYITFVQLANVAKMVITNLGKQRSKYFKWRDPATDLHLFSKLKILSPSRLWFQGPARVPKKLQKVRTYHYWKQDLT